MFYNKKNVLNYFPVFTGKHLFWSLFLIKLLAFRPASLLRRDSHTDVFLWILWNFQKYLFWRISVNGFFSEQYNHLHVVVVLLILLVLKALPFCLNHFAKYRDYYFYQIFLIEPKVMDGYPLYVSWLARLWFAWKWDGNNSNDWVSSAQAKRYPK